VSYHAQVSARLRIRKYESQLSKLKSGLLIAKVESEVEKLAAEVSALVDEAVESRARVLTEQEQVRQIAALNSLTHELVAMNRRLWEAARRLSHLLGSVRHLSPRGVQAQIEELHRKLAAGATMRERLLDASPGAPEPGVLDARLAAALPLFHELERLFGADARFADAPPITSTTLSPLCSGLLGLETAVSASSSSRGSLSQIPARVGEISRLELSPGGRGASPGSARCVSGCAEFASIGRPRARSVIARVRLRNGRAEEENSLIFANPKATSPRPNTEPSGCESLSSLAKEVAPSRAVVSQLEEEEEEEGTSSKTSLFPPSDPLVSQSSKRTSDQFFRSEDDDTAKRPAPVLVRPPSGFSLETDTVSHSSGSLQTPRSMRQQRMLVRVHSSVSDTRARELRVASFKARFRNQPASAHPSPSSDLHVRPLRGSPASEPEPRLRPVRALTAMTTMEHQGMVVDPRQLAVPLFDADGVIMTAPIAVTRLGRPRIHVYDAQGAPVEFLHALAPDTSGSDDGTSSGSLIELRGDRWRLRRPECRWTRPLLKNTIDAQLGRSDLTIAIARAQLELARVTKQVRQLTEERAMLETRQTLNCCIWTEAFTIQLQRPLPKVVSTANTGCKPRTTCDQLTAIARECERSDQQAAEVASVQRQITLAQEQLTASEKELARRKRKIGDIDAELAAKIQTAHMKLRETVAERRKRIDTIDAQIFRAGTLIRQLTDAVEDTQRVVHILQEKIADNQAGERPDLARNLHEIQIMHKECVEKMQLIELESKQYDDQAQMLRTLTTPGAIDELQTMSDQLRRTLAAKKSTFSRFLRPTKRFRCPLTNIYELAIFTERTVQIDLLLLTMKRREQTLRTKIDSARRDLVRFHIRVPSNATFDQPV
jgi:hypothetical protein